MKRGLTYSAMAATVTTLVILGFANLIHMFSEIFPQAQWLEQNHLDHIASVLAFTSFIVLAVKSGRVKV